MNAGSYFLIAGLALTSSLQVQATHSSPENHPAEYKKFLEALDKQHKDQSYDYFAAMEIVLNATKDELSNIEWLEKAAKDEKPAAMYFLANWKRLDIQQRKRSEVNEEVLAENHKLFAEAAELGFIPAIVQVAIDYIRGTGVPKNPNKGIEMLAEASRDGNFIARHRWLKLTNRLSTEADLERPEVQSEIKRGNHFVMYDAAVLCQSKEKRFDYLTMASDAGNTTALVFKYQTFLKIDANLAMKNAVRGAGLHDAELMAVVGGWLINPDVIKKHVDAKDFPHSPVEGMQFIKIASMMGNDYANEMLGNFYYKGLYGVEKDEKRAFEHFKRGALTKAAGVSHLIYAYFLMKGIGCEVDYKEATRHLIYLTHMKYYDAYILLAYLQYYGYGIEKNTARAETMLQEHAIAYPITYAYLALIKSREKDPNNPDEEIANHYLRLAEMAPLDKGVTRALYKMSVDKGDWAFSFIVRDVELEPYLEKQPEK